MSSPTVYLVTGANRGIGHGLVKSLLTRPNTTVIASVRTLSESNLETLTSLPVAKNSTLIPIKIDAFSETDPKDAVKTLTSEHGIEKVDIVIANSGISKYYGPVSTTPISELREHWEVNTLGTTLVFQAFFPLLQKSSNNPRFIAISTGAATISQMERIPAPLAAYGSSKAALNFIVRRIHFENEWLVTFAINPGFVRTEMGNMGAKAFGLDEAPVSIEDSVNGLLNKVDNATREESGGKFLAFDEDTFGW